MTIARSTRLSILAALCAWSLSAPLLAAHDLADTTQFDIAANTPLSEALIQWANRTGMQVMFASQAVGDQKSPPLNGSFTARTALTSILQNSGLSYAIEGRTVTIVPATLRHTYDDHTDDTSRPADDIPSAEPTDSMEISQAAPSPQSTSNPDKLDEVLITGTHIRGVSAVGSSTSSYSNSDIIESGRTTLGDFLQTIPENFGGGQNPNVVGASGAQNAPDAGYISGPNLRGLGSDSTLNVINGHRMAVSGFANGADISMLPISAIDRIEVLKDSASAQYGSDAVGGVVNYILKQSYDGMATTVATTLPTHGGGASQRYDTLGGVSWSDGNVLMNYEYSSQDHLLSSDRIFSEAAGPPANTLVPGISQHSGLLVANERPTDSLALFMQGVYGHKNGEDVSSDPGLLVSNNFQSETSYALSGGLDLRLAHDWRAEFTGTGASTTVRGTSLSDYIPLDALSTNTGTYTNSISSAEVTTDGPIVPVPAGQIKAAIGGGYRKEQFSNTAGGDGFSPVFLSAHRSIQYGYLELNVPVIGDGMGVRLIKQLTLSFSGRYEHYSDVGSSSVPQIGASYIPIDGLTIRGSWGKAFRAPSFTESSIGEQVYLFDEPDASSSTGVTRSMLLAGANPNLKPQRATSWTSGFDCKIPWFAATTISASYFQIEYSQRITTPIPDSAGALNGSENGAFIVRNPSPGLQASVIANAGAQNFYNETPDTYDPGTVGALIFDQNQNISNQRVRGVDLSIQHEREFLGGDLHFFEANSWLKLTQQLTPESPQQSLAGTIFYPPRQKLRAGISWNRKGLGMSLFGNYIGTFKDNVQIPNQRIASWPTLDSQLMYRSEHLQNGLGQFYVSVSFLNMLDRRPPYIAPTSTNPAGFGFDSTNANAFGRLINLQITLSW